MSIGSVCYQNIFLFLLSTYPVLRQITVEEVCFVILALLAESRINQLLNHQSNLQMLVASGAK